jgi:hypothetical protein
MRSVNFTRNKCTCSCESYEKIQQHPFGADDRTTDPQLRPYRTLAEHQLILHVQFRGRLDVSFLCTEMWVS